MGVESSGKQLFSVHWSLSCFPTQEVTTKHPSKKHRGLSSSEHRVYHIKFAHLVGLESHDLQPTSLEEGEGAEGPPMSSESARRPVVGELPLDYQIYQMVESAGARGVSTVVRGVSTVVRVVSTVVRGVSTVVRGVFTVVRGVVLYLMEHLLMLCCAVVVVLWCCCCCRSSVIRD